jgi:hypothetical protein
VCGDGRATHTQKNSTQNNTQQNSGEIVHCNKSKSQNITICSARLLKLSAERASLCKSGLSSGWLAQGGVAAAAHDDGLSVAEHSGAARTKKMIEYGQKLKKLTCNTKCAHIW